MRHIDTNFLWVQEISARREIDFNKIPGGANTADMMTKGVTREIMERHFKELGLKKNQPRPQSASQIISEENMRPKPLGSIHEVKPGDGKGSTFRQ